MQNIYKFFIKQITHQTPSFNMACIFKSSPQENQKLPEKNESKYLTGLKVRNTMSPNNLVLYQQAITLQQNLIKYLFKKVEFIPHKGKQIKFYICGPTVYTASHIGHARTYISADIIKRILTKYFNYDVIHAMNVTDLDDKIIIQSNQLGQEFTSFTRKYEMDFWEDMQLLNVSLPDVITRVSEYVPEIVKYIEKIIQNGYAYESNGSVYFDVNKFHNAPQHYYAKLDPFRSNDIQGLQEADGALTIQNSEKKSERDFVLWKASKPGEPFWQSPWGTGRPGWHIECSAMASEVLDYPIDMHLGGEDLKFPHHDNELAQSEAYYDHKEHNQWVNYFIHTGHLYIQGCVMSRSKKNFFTIKDILEHVNPRVLRILFMKQSYDSIMDYTISSIEEAKAKDKRLYEFYTNLNGILLQQEINTNQKWSKRELELRDLLTEKQENIHKHFTNNFDIPNVMKEIDDLITGVNKYIRTRPYIHLLLRTIFNYIKHIFDTLGLDYDIKQSVSQSFIQSVNVISTLRDEIRGSNKDFGLIASAALKAQNQLTSIISKADKNENTVQAIQIASEFIESIIKSSSTNDYKLIMQSTDDIRDKRLIQIGVSIEDEKLGESSLWKLEDRELLLVQEQEKTNQQLLKQQEQARKKEEKLKKMSVNPTEMFRNNQKYKDYSFNEIGIPIADEKETPLKQAALNSFRNKWDIQKKLYDEFLLIMNSEKK